MTNQLDLRVSYRTILSAAREKQFISYGDLARANDCKWSKVRYNIGGHLGDLIEIAASRGWPLLGSIVMNKEDVRTGKLQGSARDGFLVAARELDFRFSDPDAFVEQQQKATFDWAPGAPDDLVPDVGGSNSEQPSGPRFVRLFGAVLDVLRSLGGTAKPRHVFEALKKSPLATPEDRQAFLQDGRPRLDREIQWARFYLSKANLIESKERGIWRLTPEGRYTHLDHRSALEVYRVVQDRFKASSKTGLAPANDGTVDLFDDLNRQFWFVGAMWDGDDDQLDRFLSEGIWQNGHDGMYVEQVTRMKPNDRIAIKASYVRKYGLPFPNDDQHVSCMRIKAIGTITEATIDGRTVKVEWEPDYEPREWYFYTYRKRIIAADVSENYARRLIQFAFGDRKQDYEWWLNQPYWARQFSLDVEPPPDPEEDEEIAKTEAEEPELTPYGIQDIIGDGSFVGEEKLRRALSRLKERKNLILQGPPGTGKTWLAKRLGYALLQTRERIVTRKRMRSIQFHPSISYEDFVRGWRPGGNGQISLVNGVFLEAVEAARAKRDMPFVVIIEEINRGNPAQIFGEMLTLLEYDKRKESEAIELTYRQKGNERIYIPENLYVIGTMNIADRSLALVDLALRRRFAFISLETLLNDRWRKWCIDKAGADEALLSTIQERITELNEEIAGDRSLGTQFRVGHSYVTPAPSERIEDTRAWFVGIVETEIGPLLEEYWFENIDRAKSSKRALLEGF